MHTKCEVDKGVGKDDIPIKEGDKREEINILKG
jgi:hypothetical protein